MRTGPPLAPGKSGATRKTGGLRFGLCCIFRREPIKFRQITAKSIQTLARREQLVRLSEICLHNTRSLLDALRFAAKNGIGAFRILTPLFPRYTHPLVGYGLDDLPDREAIRAVFDEIRAFSEQQDLRLGFHPDQFNVLSSNRPDVVQNTARELEYQNLLAEMADVEVINLHVGGAYGNKEKALARLRKNVRTLPKAVLRRLTLENDDKSFAPADLLPTCETLDIPMVYDIHHHRCLPDGLSEEEVTARVVGLWQKLGREPYFHISSPKNGWQSGAPRPHADYIDPADFPDFWLDLTATVDVEAKAKELAVLKLINDLGHEVL